MYNLFRNPLQYTGILHNIGVETYVLYEGWNFNSGNYLFTTDTK